MKNETKEEAKEGERQLRERRHIRVEVEAWCARCGDSIGVQDRLFGETHCDACIERYRLDEAPRRRKR